jgi:hypothetical protein
MSLYNNDDDKEDDDNDDFMQQSNSIPSHKDTHSTEETTLSKTIEMMEANTYCFDPIHYHSFQSVSFILLPIYTCCGCGGRLQHSSVFMGSISSRPVQCVACGVYCHRSCAFNKELNWEEDDKKCSVNWKTYEETCSQISSSSQQQQQQPTASVVTYKTHDDQSSDLVEDETISDLPTNDTDMNEIEEVTDDRSSIFRPSREMSLLDYDTFEERPMLTCAVSEDGILDGSCNRNMQQTRTNFPFLSAANFPFLSAAKLFLNNDDENSCHNNNTVNSNNDYARENIVRLNTWHESCHPFGDRVVESSNSISGLVESSCAMSLGHVSASGSLPADAIVQHNQWTDDGPPPHWADESSIAKIIAKSQQIREKEEEENTQQPLHFASGFRAVSQALQENIFATFGRLVSHEPSESERKNIQEKVMSRQTVETASGEKVDADVKSLVGPEPDTIGKKRLGIATLAGSLVGGVAGLAMAGPVGGLIGVKAGQTAGILGLLLEGGFTVGVFAAGSYSGRHLVEKIEEKTQARVLALGEGTNRQVLLLIRPSKPEPDAEWEQIYGEARKTYSGRGGIVERIISSESHKAKQERYEREVDIVNTEENEIPTVDKVS